MSMSKQLKASSVFQAVHRYHAAHFLTLAQQVNPELAGPHQAVWLHRLETEHGKLRAALA
jgi:hypothetical protein